MQQCTWLQGDEYDHASAETNTVTEDNVTESLGELPESHYALPVAFWYIWLDEACVKTRQLLLQLQSYY